MIHRGSVQVWTRLGLLSIVKIGNFSHMHHLLTHRVTEACAMPHSLPPQVMFHQGSE